MSQSFNGTGNLTSLDVNNWDTSNMTSMSAMFAYTSLEELNLNHFNTSNVTDMTQMFVGMNDLKKLNIGNFDTTKVNSFEYIFANDFSLSEITLGNNTLFSKQNTYLPLVSTESGEFTGCWIKVVPENPFSVYETSDTFMSKL